MKKIRYFISHGCSESTFSFPVLAQSYVVLCARRCPKTFKILICTLTGVTQLVEHRPAKQEVASSIPWVSCSVPGWGVYKRQLINVSHIDVSLPPFPSLKNK